MNRVLLSSITNKTHPTNLLKKLITKKYLITKNYRKKLQGPI